MLKKYKKRSNQCALLFVLGAAGSVLIRGSGVLPELFAQLIAVGAAIMLFLAFCFLSKSKGYHWALGLPLAIFVPLSLIVFWLLPDKCKEEK